MSKLVADSCVLVKGLVAEPGSAAARQLLEAYFVGKLELLAPDFVFAEISNVLWKKARRPVPVRRNGILRFGGASNANSTRTRPKPL